MSYYGADTVVRGSWNLICDRCGFKMKHYDSMKEWNGFVVCKECWEPRHTLDFVLTRAEKDEAVPYSRPDPVPVEIGCANINAIAGLAVAGCAISGRDEQPQGTFNTDVL